MIHKHFTYFLVFMFIARCYICISCHEIELLGRTLSLSLSVSQVTAVSAISQSRCIWLLMYLLMAMARWNILLLFHESEHCKQGDAWGWVCLRNWSDGMESTRGCHARATFTEWSQEIQPGIQLSVCVAVYTLTGPLTVLNVQPLCSMLTSAMPCH